MSGLTETFCLKVSKEMKSFLDDTDNSSNYVRKLILQNMRIRDKVNSISFIENVDGEDYLAYDENELQDLVSDEVVKTIVSNVFEETGIVLKKKR